MYRDKKKKNHASGNQGQEQKGWKLAAKGLGLAWIVTLILLVVATVMIYFDLVSVDLISLVAKGVMILSMAVGGVYVFKNTKGNGRIWILIMLIWYLAVRFLLSLILTFL